MINARTNARARAPRERVRGVTDNVIREKGKVRGAHHLAEVSVTCLMDSAERVITVGRRYGRNRAFFSSWTSWSSRSGLGPGRFIHSCEKYACSRALQLARARYAMHDCTQVGLNPASGSRARCRAIDARDCFRIGRVCIAMRAYLTRLRIRGMSSSRYR